MTSLSFIIFLFFVTVPAISADTDECAKTPCKNGASCKQNAPGKGYTCTCATGWEGTNCDKDTDECAKTPCKNGASCKQNAPGKGYTCTCATGWEGTNCDKDTDECAKTPCKNGASCKQNAPGKGYTCTCATGWEGTNCDKDTDECAKTPCKNGASCKQNAPGKGYTCTCATGWEGTNCDKDTDECAKTPCKNGASCKQNKPGKGYTCTCATGWKGTNCDKDINECVGVICKNGGKCQQNAPGKGYTCKCAPGWEGKHCGSDINECNKVSCKNGGKCKQNAPGKGYTCHCSPGWEGKHCEKDINECAKTPCKNGATCKQNKPGKGYTCTCATGWEGKNCDKDIDECKSVTCKNGGSCTQNAPGLGYKCHCRKGWEGKHCEGDINECIGVNCKNGGSCVQNPPGKGYKCNCLRGWNGDHCENDINECIGVTCHNGGKCAQNPPGKGYRCICLVGFSGLHCKTDHRIDLAILIEASNVIHKTEFEDYKTIAKTALKKFNVGQAVVRVSTAKFSASVLRGNWLEESASLKVVTDIINGFTFDGTRPNTWLALDHARRQLLNRNGNRVGVRKALLLIGSGETNEYFHTVEELQDLHNAGISVYVAGHDTESNVLFSTVPVTSQFVIPFVLKQSKVIEIANAIGLTINEDTDCGFGERDHLGTCVDVDECMSVNPCHNGGKCVNTVGGYTCGCEKSSKRGGNRMCKVSEAVDIVMILDSSENVYLSEWPKLFDLFRVVSQLMHVHPDYVRVSLISYADKIQRETSLDTCHSHYCLLTVMRTWKWDGGIGKPYLAFDEAITLLLAGRASRPAGKSVVIYFGSGHTDDEAKTLLSLNLMARHKITMYSFIYITANYLSTKANNGDSIRIPDVLDYGTIWEDAIQMSEFITADSKCDYGFYYDPLSSRCVDFDECNLSGSSVNPCGNGGSCYNLDYGYKCPCSNGNKNCKDMLVADVAILFDQSNSLTVGQFFMFKTILINLAKKFEIHPDYVRLSVVQYAAKVSTLFNLASCDYNPCVDNLMSKANLVRKSNEAPALDVALETIRDRVLNGPGSRRKVPKFLIYLGSGKGAKGKRVQTAAEHLWYAGMRILAAVPNAVGKDDLTPYIPSSSAFVASSTSHFVLTAKAAQDANCKFGYTASSDFICKNIDECSIISKPCLNGGTCSDTDGSYNCPCGNNPNCVERTLLDVALYIESSNVVLYPYLLSIAQEIIGHYSVHLDYVRVATVLYGSAVKVVTKLNQCDDSFCVLDALKSAKPTGGTQDSWVAFEHAPSLFATGGRANVPDAMILISDGRTTDASKTLYALTDASATGMRLYTLTTRGSGDVVGDVMQPKVNGFAIGPARLNAKGITDIAYNVVQATTLDKLCASGYSHVKGTCTDIDECKAVSPCVNKGVCINKDSYFVCPCSGGHKNCIEMVKLDLTIIVDASSSVYASEFAQIKQLTKNIINQFYIHPDFVQVALVSYADATNEMTTLSKCTDAQCVIASMSTLVHYGYAPETHTVLEKARKEYLVNGARSKTPKCVLYIGSGVGTERALTMLSLEKLWLEKTRVYALLYNIEDDILRMTMSEHYYTDIPFSLTDQLLKSLPPYIAHKIGNDLMCPFGKTYDKATKKCTDIDECSGHPCLTGGKCVNTAGSFECKLS
ncbi:uncharacterized protein LOC141898270 isoform X2 [Tubulanus polymorphus]|uniref:uncharacterized protein LOC141898270 isoform X2 n=1 Tax=Tubulanus polymorphus TaxID=672921 RepID=UPI003DA50D51